ncbi:MAG: FAD-dependent oxidoreductase [Candidatus Bathyarchaeia archaeon]
MGIDESVITKAIVKAATDKLYKLADVDVIVVGAGPAGLTAATYLAKNRLNTLLVESIGKSLRTCSTFNMNISRITTYNY